MTTDEAVPAVLEHDGDLEKRPPSKSSVPASKFTLRTWALAYARHGWPVFPLVPGGKIPALPKRLGGRGCLDATTDVDTVGRMWARYPLGNVGIATGEAARLAVLDVDPRDGGDDALAALVARHGPVPAGPGRS